MSTRRRFKPYPAYKDSGVEWLGAIPAHWDAAQMWRISEATSGGTPAKEERGYWDGEIPWVSPKDMKRRFIDSSEDTVTERAIRETGIKLIEPPVVLIVVRGMILAHTFPVAVARVPVTINQDMKALRFRQSLEPIFAAWLFEGVGKGILGAVVEEAAHGTRVIRMDRWRAVVAPVPPTIEQRAIAAFLDRETARIDALVAKKERLIELLQEQRTAGISAVVTGQMQVVHKDEGGRMKEDCDSSSFLLQPSSFRLQPSSFPKKASAVEWLGEIPAHWEVKRIRDVAEALQTGPFGSQLHANEYVLGGHPVINPANLREGRLVPDYECTVADATAERLEHHRLLDGDILFARRGELGRCGLVTEQEHGWLCGTGCLRLRVRHDATRPKFLIRLLSTSGVAEWLGLQSVGATMQNLNTVIIGRIPVVVPPRAEQEVIAAFLDRETARIDALVAKVRDAIERLKELRTALISAAVTGKIDVSEG